MGNNDTTIPAGLGEITLYTDHAPIKEEILEARKQRLRDKGWRI